MCHNGVMETREEKARAAMQRAETRYSDAMETGDAEKIQKAETAYTNAKERWEAECEKEAFRA